MNKKVAGLFVVFLVAVLACGAVSATNLSNHDFDGYFSMKVPKNINFQKQDDSINENDCGEAEENLFYVIECKGLVLLG